MKEYAHQYYELGLNPTCISYLKTKYNIRGKTQQKTPSHSWKRWQVRRPAFEEISSLDWETSNGIGAVLGFNSKCIDIDNCDDYEFIKAFLAKLALPLDYEWVVKSPNGFHIHVKSGPIYFATHNELTDGVLPVSPNEKYNSTFSRVELRWGNHIVLPPTIINGKKYQFINNSLPISPPIRVDMFLIFMALSKFCGNTNSPDFGNFEAQKMIFQLMEPSSYEMGLPRAQAFYGTYYEDRIKNATNSKGFIVSSCLPQNVKVGHIDFQHSQSSYIYKSATRPEFFLDVETTGLIKDELDYENYPRVIQIAYYNSHSKEKGTLFIKPEGFVVPPDIEKLTGISTEFLLNNGISIKEALRSLNKSNSSPIIAHNADFDLSVIDAEYLRINKSGYLPNKFRNGTQVFCTMKKFQSIFGGKYPKLSDMYHFFFDDLPPLDLHNASNDIEILRDCYNIMHLYGCIQEDHENGLII